MNPQDLSDFISSKPVQAKDYTLYIRRPSGKPMVSLEIVLGNSSNHCEFKIEIDPSQVEELADKLILMKNCVESIYPQDK